MVADKATENFLNRSEQSVELTEEQFFDVFMQVKTRVALDSLCKKGLVDYFEDENGEECFFATEKGKIFSNNKKDDK